MQIFCIRGGSLNIFILFQTIDIWASVCVHLYIDAQSKYCSTKCNKSNNPNCYSEFFLLDCWLRKYKVKTPRYPLSTPWHWPRHNAGLALLHPSQDHPRAELDHGSQQQQARQAELRCHDVCKHGKTHCKAGNMFLFYVALNDFRVDTHFTFNIWWKWTHYNLTHNPIVEG